MPEYKSNAIFEEMILAMEPHLPNWLPEKIQNKKKVYDRINDVWCYTGTKDKPTLDIWDRQNEVSKAIKNIQVSHLLGSNEIIIPIIVEEYRVLSQALKTLETEVASRVKKAPEMKQLSESLTCYKQKMISGLLYDDLNQLSSMGIEFDIKEQMNKYKGN